MYRRAGMTHMAILLTIGPLANSAIYHLPVNQELPFSGTEAMGVEDADMGKDLSMTENCNAENLSANLADEIRYRWWPSVEHRSIPPASQAGTGDSKNTDLTFEAVSRYLARKWFPAQSTSTTTTNTASDGTICNSEECHRDSDSSPAGEGLRSSLPSSSTGSALSTESPRVQVQHNGSPTSTAESQLLFLARHGETDMNAAGKLQGRGVDAQLNGVGARQATELGRFLRNVPFDTVTSSSLRRAFETALRVVEENVKCAETAQKNGSPDTEKVPVMKHEGLDELSWGELEGQDSGEEPWKGKLENLRSAWNAGHFDRAAVKGESVLEVEARARAAVEACLDKGGALNLVVSHGRTLRILILSLTGMGLDQMKNIGKVPNTALYVIEARREAPGMPRSYHLITPVPDVRSEEANDV